MEATAWVGQRGRDRRRVGARHAVGVRRTLGHARSHARLGARPATGQSGRRRLSRVCGWAIRRAIPVGAYTYQPGIGYAITDDDLLTIEDYWAGYTDLVEADVANALREISDGLTLRGGRLLAPFGIRFVIVPLADGANGTIESLLPPPGGLIDVLDDQLDLAAPLTKPPNYIVYENTAYTPTRSVLSPEGAAASQQAGGEVLAEADLRGSVPFGVGSPDRGDVVGDIAAGTLHVAVPYDRNWQLIVDGQRVVGRRAFGSTLAFDVPNGGRATLSYQTDTNRTLWLARPTGRVATLCAGRESLPAVAFGRRRAGTVRWSTPRRSSI